MGTQLRNALNTGYIDKPEDSAHASGDYGVMLLAVRKDTATALAGTDGDYIPVIVDSSGRLHVAPLVAGTAAIGKLAANDGVDIGNVDVASITAGTNVIGKIRLVTEAGNEITNDTDDSVKTMPPRTELTEHPFGKGSLLIGGAQYCTPVTGVTNAAYVAVETRTITQPLGYTLVEIELGLTAATGSSGITDATLFKWQASDAGSLWTDLCAEQTAAKATAYVDATLSGRFAPTGNFLGTGTTFQVRFVITSAGATDTANGKTKNSSYIIARYRR